VADHDFSEARRAIAEIEELDREVESQEQARNAYDDNAYMRGMGLLVVFIALILALTVGLSVVFGVGDDEEMDLEEIMKQQPVEDDW
jgi:hypothetical protein